MGSRTLPRRRLRSDRGKHRLNPPGLDSRDPTGTDRLLDLVNGGLEHGPPVGEARSQPRVGDVAVAVVGVLGEDRQDQLIERSAVGLVPRAAVESAQTVSNRAHPAPVWLMPLRQALGGAACGRHPVKAISSLSLAGTKKVVSSWARP